MAPAPTLTNPTCSTIYFSRFLSNNPTQPPPVYNPHAHQDFSISSPQSQRDALAARASIAQARKDRAEEKLVRAEAGLGLYSRSVEGTLPVTVAADHGNGVETMELPTLAHRDSLQLSLTTLPRARMDEVKQRGRYDECAPMGYYDAYDLERARDELEDWRFDSKSSKKKEKLHRDWSCGIGYKDWMAILTIYVIATICVGAYVGVLNNLGDKALQELESHPNGALDARGVEQQTPACAARSGSKLIAQSFRS